MKEAKYKEFLMANNLNYNVFVDEFVGFSRIDDDFYVLSHNFDEDTKLWDENQTRITKDDLRKFIKCLRDFVEDYNI